MPAPAPRSRRATAVALACVAPLALALVATAPATAAVVADPVVLAAEDAPFHLLPVGSYGAGTLDEGAAEIVAHYPAGQRLLVVNAQAATVDVLDVADPAAPTKLFELQTTGVPSADGSTVSASAVANSVAVRADGLGAVAVEADPKTDAGWVVFFDAASTGAALGAVRVGALPDSVTFTPDGSRVVVANEAEPADDYSVDPEGSIAVIDVPAAVAAPAQSAVRIADFHDFEAGGSRPLPAGIRIFGGREDAGTGVPARPVSENLEPEYPTVSADSSTAWVTLQEANGLARVDLDSATVERIAALGTVDRRTVPFDPSDDDGGVRIGAWPVRAMFQPDTIDSYTVDGATYLVTANEGDTRAWRGYNEESRVSAIASKGAGPVCADSDAAAALGAEALGRLNVSIADGFDAANGCYAELHTFGTRSFSIWSADGELVWDSGDAIERITAEALPEAFNTDHGSVELDDRSDNKGPEPEAVAVGQIEGRTYAFVGLERIGGIISYDVTDPAAPVFVSYVNNRDVTVDAEADLAGAGDLGPESIAFIPAADSPSGAPMLAVGNEVSGTTTLFAVDVVADAGAGSGGGGDGGGAEAAPELAATGADAQVSATLGGIAILALLAGALLLTVRRRSARA